VIRIRLRVPLSQFELSLSLDLEKPVTALFGPSGVGKTTLLETMAGLRQPAEGEIRVDQVLVYSSELGISLPPEKRRFGLVPQDALLFPHLDVRRNLLYGSRDGGALSFSSVVKALEIGHLLEQPPSRLSGGERQRVSLGRALLSQPRLLLLDEPVASLDVNLKERILPYVKRVRDLHRIPALVVSHDVGDVLALADEVVILNRGAVVDRGEPRAMLTRLGVQGMPGAFFRGRFENLLEARVLGHDAEEGVTRVETDRGLSLLIPIGAETTSERVLLGVLAEDVLLSREPPAGLSARNIIPGVIRTIQAEGGVSMVEVEAKESLFARVTGSAVRSLDLQPGSSVHLILKTHSIHRLP
jgi:molybdate transport system ATP-binding protein